MPYLDIFGLEFENKILIFEISTLEFVKIEFLTDTVNFGIESSFSDAPDAGLGLIYKVCQK